MYRITIKQNGKGRFIVRLQKELIAGYGCYFTKITRITNSVVRAKEIALELYERMLNVCLETDVMTLNCKI